MSEELKIISEESLSTEEREKVNAIVQSIDVKDSAALLQYGAEPQRKIAEFSESALSNVRTKDLGEAGEMLTALISELKSLDVNEKQGFFEKLFKKASAQAQALKTKYGKAEESVERIVSALENHQIRLLKDVTLLDGMYEKNLENYKELSLYILAGKQKLSELREKTLTALTEKAKQTDLPEDAQAARDLSDLCERFEKKIHDLELTRMVAIQMAPQIRLVQGNDTLMSEKIQTTVNNTIPLWKSQLLIALGVEHSIQATEAQRKVSDMTNELLRQNAEKLKTATTGAALEAERGIVDIETLRDTNRLLIETLDEVVKIQEEGHAKRAAAEQELLKLEGEVKEKLLEIRG